MRFFKSLKEFIGALKEIKLFKVLKNPKNLLFVFIIWSLIFYFFVYKVAEYFNPNLRDHKFYLFMILSLLLSIQIFCFFYTVRTIIKLRKNKGIGGVIVSILSLLILPFSKMCVLGICGLALPSFIVTILPFFAISFIIEYLSLVLVILILANILSLKTLGCFKKEKIEFKINNNFFKQK